MEEAIAGRSKIRNVCIAEIFSRMRIIVQWGTGFQRMIQGCKEYGIRESEFIDMGDDFRVNFYRSDLRTGTEKENTGIEIARAVDDTGIEGKETGIQNMRTGIEKKNIIDLSTLPDTERKIVGFLLENPEITQEQIAQSIGMSKNGIRYAMSKLKEKGILMREGATKKERWIINHLK